MIVIRFQELVFGMTAASLILHATGIARSVGLVTIFQGSELTHAKMYIDHKPGGHDQIHRCQ